MSTNRSVGLAALPIVNVLEIVDYSKPASRYRMDQTHSLFEMSIKDTLISEYRGT